MAHLHVHQVSPIRAGIHQHPLSEASTLLQSACAFPPHISSLYIKTKCLFSQGLAMLLSSAVVPLCTATLCLHCDAPKLGVGEEAETPVSSQEGLCPRHATSDP